jgi:hypothetical protein
VNHYRQFLNPTGPRIISGNNGLPSPVSVELESPKQMKGKFYKSKNNPLNQQQSRAIHIFMILWITNNCFR